MQKLTEEYVAQLERKNVLALDCAEHTGYYSTHGYGTWYFPSDAKAPKKLGEDYQQHKCFRETIMKFVQENNIKVIASEDVNVGKHFNALKKLSQFQGVLFELCATLDIPLIVFNVSEIKRWATGDGNASKQKMMEYAIKRWHIDPEGDDNVGDATHIFFHFIHRYKL